jgi:hypothetical protein
MKNYRFEKATCGLSRRALIRNGLLVGLGATAVVAALPELTGTALASNIDADITVILEQTQYNYSCQVDWWYCIKCYGMYHSDNDTAGGVCPAGGEHQNNTNYTLYCIPHDGDAQGQTSPYVCGVQPGWRWCSKCQGLFWGSAQTESVCPAGGQHIITSGTYVYDLSYGQPIFEYYFDYVETELIAQSDWLYCVKCRGLFFGHGSTADGVCPAGGTHSQYSGSYNYDMLPYPDLT